MGPDDGQHHQGDAAVLRKSLKGRLPETQGCRSEYRGNRWRRQCWRDPLNVVYSDARRRGVEFGGCHFDTRVYLSLDWSESFSGNPDRQVGGCRGDIEEPKREPGVSALSDRDWLAHKYGNCGNH